MSALLAATPGAFASAAGREACFHMGPGTFIVPMSLHAENRAKLVAAMAAAGHTAGAVLLAGGRQLSRDNTDHELLFRQESCVAAPPLPLHSCARLRFSYATLRLPLTRPCRYFAFLFGVQEADWYGAIDLATGKATVFVPRLPES